MGDFKNIISEVAQWANIIDTLTNKDKSLLKYIEKLQKDLALAREQKTILLDAVDEMVSRAAYTYSNINDYKDRTIKIMKCGIKACDKVKEIDKKEGE